MTYTLKPCPFCGNDESVDPEDTPGGGWRVVCHYCGCATRREATKAGAVERWNTRDEEVKHGKA